MQPRLLAMIVLALYGVGQGAAGSGPNRVTVCSESTVGPSFVGARALATSVLKSAGVSLAWRGSGQCPAGALQIGMSLNTPEVDHPGALAYSFPFEGAHVVVFLDRIKGAVPEPLEGRLLGNVLAHEINHVLEGVEQHSPTGLMMAKWTFVEYRKMTPALPLTPEDVALIHAGLASRGRSAAAGEN